MQLWPDLFNGRTPIPSLDPSPSELTLRVNRLRMCSEQMLIHLKSLGKDSRDADDARETLSRMTQEINLLKDQRRKIHEMLD